MEDLAAFDPPLMVNVTFEAPFVSSETRMFSMDWAVSAQFNHADVNAEEISDPVLSNMFAGKFAKLLALRQLSVKRVALAKFNDGKVTSPVSRHVLAKLSTLDTSIVLLKSVRLEVPSHASLRVVPSWLPPTPSILAILVSDTAPLKYGL